MSTKPIDGERIKKEVFDMFRNKFKEQDQKINQLYLENKKLHLINQKLHDSLGVMNYDREMDSQKIDRQKITIKKLKHEAVTADSSIKERVYGAENNQRFEELNNKLSIANMEIEKRDRVKKGGERNIDEKIKEAANKIERKVREEMIQSTFFHPHSICEAWQYLTSSSIDKKKIKRRRYYDKQEMLRKHPDIGIVLYRIQNLTGTLDLSNVERKVKTKKTKTIHPKKFEMVNVKNKVNQKTSYYHKIKEEHFAKVAF